MIREALSPYRVLEEIGAGGMGVLYRAQDEPLNHDVAVKVLTPGTLMDENSRKRFRKFAVAIFCSANYRCG
jgi:eukaryotic-like serine/threonine-protein kinase